MSDAIVGPPPVKVLYSSTTGWSPDAPESLRNRPLVVPYQEQTKPTPMYHTDPPKTSRWGKRAAVERASKPAGRPRTLPVRVPNTSGKGVRNPAINIERILALRAEGKTNTAIASEIGCAKSAISKHLAKYKKSSGDAVALLAAAMICECGRSKHAHRKACRMCRRNMRRREARLVAKGEILRGGAE